MRRLQVSSCLRTPADCCGHCGAAQGWEVHASPLSGEELYAANAHQHPGIKVASFNEFVSDLNFFSTDAKLRENIPNY